MRRGSSLRDRVAHACWTLLVGITLSAVGCPAAGAFGDEPPTVAAAADLQFALTEVAEAFAAETGLEVKLAFGSSGNFARQIRQGAPFEMYLSADENYVPGAEQRRLHAR